MLSLRTLKTTGHSAIFRACKYAIKYNNYVLSAKDGGSVASIGNYSFEFCPWHASHASESLSEKSP